MDQQITIEDKIKRIAFAPYCVNWLRNHTEFLKRFIISDKRKFSLLRIASKQSGRLWLSERPQKVYEAPLNSFSFMVMYVLLKIEMIGPYFFETENVTGQSNKMINLW